MDEYTGLALTLNLYIVNAKTVPISGLQLFISAGRSHMIRIDKVLERVFKPN
ncbi:hypothetical protein GCM10020370_04380 [Paenibacillus hodogayensis]